MSSPNPPLLASRLTVSFHPRGVVFVHVMRNESLSKELTVH